MKEGSTEMSNINFSEKSKKKKKKKENQNVYTSFVIGALRLKETVVSTAKYQVVWQRKVSPSFLSSQLLRCCT